MTENAVDQLHGETSVIGRKSVLIHHPIKKWFDRRPAPVKVTECVYGCKSSGSGLFFLQSHATGVTQVLYG
jgi:hypothetical protein